MDKLKKIFKGNLKKIIALVLLVVAFFADLITHHQALEFLSQIFVGV